MRFWGDLVGKAGFKLSDAPNTWYAFWDFFKPMQKELRAKGMRKMFPPGLQVTTVGPNDGNNLFAHFMFAEQWRCGHRLAKTANCIPTSIRKYVRLKSSQLCG